MAWDVPVTQFHNALMHAIMKAPTNASPRRGLLRFAGLLSSDAAADPDEHGDFPTASEAEQHRYAHGSRPESQ